MRGRSYSPSPPPRGHGRRGRSPGPPRGRHSSRGDGPTSLLVRNLRRDCRQEDLKRPFGHFGPVKDIYLPRDYYSGEPRGFGFIQFVEPADAAEAKYQMDGQILQGREITVVFAEENRKKPTEMRARESGGSGGGGRRGPSYDRKRSPPHNSRSPPRYGGRSSRKRDYDLPLKSRHSGSVSPSEKRYSRDRSYSRSPARKQSPPPHSGRTARKYSGSPVREVSPVGSRSRSPSLIQHKRSPLVRARSLSRSRSRSPYPPEEYSRGPRKDDRSPSQ